MRKVSDGPVGFPWQCAGCGRDIEIFEDDLTSDGELYDGAGLCWDCEAAWRQEQIDAAELDINALVLDLRATGIEVVVAI